jgi:ArsR family transcriptional regulator, arsenate/arsenite/antimonite-responsive transcriptional repressor
MDQEGITRLLTALGDPHRQSIMLLLGQQGRLNVGEIASHFQISRPAISHHLKILKEARVIGSEKRGQESYYWLERDHVVRDLQEIVNSISLCPYNGNQ